MSRPLAIVIAAVLVLFAAPHARAQDSLDAKCHLAGLDGPWKLRMNNDPAAVPIAKISQTIVVACLDNSIDMRITTDGKYSTARYVADGKSRWVPAPGVWQEDRGSNVVAHWEDSSLVLAISDLMLPNRVERWTLSADGKTLTHSFEHSTTLRFVYDRE